MSDEPDRVDWRTVIETAQRDRIAEAADLLAIEQQIDEATKTMKPLIDQIEDGLTREMLRGSFIQQQLHHGTAKRFMATGEQINQLQEAVYMLFERVQTLEAEVRRLNGE